MRKTIQKIIVLSLLIGLVPPLFLLSLKNKVNDRIGLPELKTAPTKTEAFDGDNPSTPRGISAWVYDYSEGRMQAIRDYNSQVPDQRKFNYLFPYCGSLTATGKGEYHLYYKGWLSSVFKPKLRNCLVLPIVDGWHNGQFNDWTKEQYEEAAQQVAEKIINDPNADGVQMDIEPYNNGQLYFYQHLGKLLRAKGKILTHFLWGHTPQNDPAIFKACDIVVLSGYDYHPENKSAQEYGKMLADGVNNMLRLARSVNGKLMVGIPVMPSCHEYEYKQGDCGHVDTGNKQTDYISQAVEVLCRYQDDPNYIGWALWQFSDSGNKPLGGCPDRCPRYPGGAVPQEHWDLLIKFCQ